ncbi:MAG: PAS domain-containing sensor histidine kinase [Thermomicrobiales bacterium]
MSSLPWGEQLARALVANAADIILVLTEDHLCRFANPIIEERLGYQPIDVLGQNVIPLHHPDDLPRAAAMLQAAAEHPGQAAHCEVRLLRSDGAWRWMFVTAVNRITDPLIGGIVCTLHDVTERVEASIAAHSALRAQELAHQEQQRVAAAKSHFLRLLGHEFKTPLTAIAGNAELIALEAAGQEGVLESADVIRNEARRLARLIDDLLLLDRIEATGLILTREPIDLNALIADTVGHLRAIDTSRAIRLSLDRRLGQVPADPERIAQVITNLVGNAVRYSPDGGAITVGTERTPAAARIWVTDTGIGIPADQLGEIFDRYQRSRAGLARGVEGSGLGLSIVREIVELHGGAVWAESQEGTGSTFFVDLPLTVATPPGQPPLPI